MPDALNIVNKFFPQVTKVTDATHDLTIDVTSRDSNSAAVRKHDACAMAVACKRKEQADGVIVSIGTVYVIKGTTARRYKASDSVAREITSFDRGAGFAEGEYVLKAPSESAKLGGSANRGSNKHTGEGRKIKKHHFTSGIRTVLGGAGLTAGKIK